MKDHGPPEETMRRFMESLARSLDEILNGSEYVAKGERRNGFVLLLFPYGEAEGRCNYISNGAERADIIKMFETQIAHFREQEGKPQ